MDPFDERFTMAYSTTTGKKSRIPKHWLTDQVQRSRWSLTPQVRDAATPYPDGDPSESWKGDQLQAYADAKSIDLTGHKGSKADMVTAINAGLAAAHMPAEPGFDVVTPSSTGGTESSAETPA